MASKVKVRSNLKELEQLQRNIATKLIAKVGIFSNNNARDGAKTNAEIGAKHEFGSLSEGIPRRSFLKDPLEMKKEELLEKAKKIISNNIDKKDGSKKIFELIGILGESIVQEAFDTGGFGNWESLKASTITKKGSNRILIDSSQLRRSIISKVDKRK